MRLKKARRLSADIGKHSSWQSNPRRGVDAVHSNDWLYSEQRVDAGRASRKRAAGRGQTMRTRNTALVTLSSRRAQDAGVVPGHNGRQQSCLRETSEKGLRIRGSHVVRL